MAQKEESQILKMILQFLEINKHYAVRINSGKIMSQYTLKNGRTKNYVINLAPEGTPDILAQIGNLFVGIEVKKDEKEVERWIKVTNKFSKDSFPTYSYRREIAQWKTAEKIKKGGEYILCGSFDSFLEQYKKITNDKKKR